MTMPAEAPAPTGANLRHVGLWGATQSGKTTFISSLFLATSRLETNDVRIRGNNVESTDFLIRNTHILNQQRKFPQATVARQQLSWTIQMLVPNRASRWLRRSAPDRVPFDFSVDLQDVGGFEHGAVPELDPSSRLDIGGGGTTPNTNIASYFRTCQGLLLLIDPIRERTEGDAYNFFFGTLLRLAQEAPVPAGQRLPHYIAVCVTKFDDPEVYEFARNRGLISYRDDDPVMLPRVHPDDAEQLIRRLFQELEKSDIDLVISGLRKYFYADRVRFFISSAVGFYVGKTGQFNVRDYKNVTEREGETVIRGAIRPINVAEPLLWLGESIAAETRQ